MKNKIIELKNISKSFKTKFVITRALNSISLAINESEFVAITGPSGCGKSTLLSVIGVLDKADSGEYILAGVNIDSLNASQKSQVRNKHIGFIFQPFNLIEEFSAIENVILPLKYMGIPKKEAHAKAFEVLKKVGLEKRINHYPSQLSGGQQQRVAIARALVTSPDIILADEPTGNLDLESGKAVMSILLNLYESGQTILLVTHDEQLAKLASKQVRLIDGCIV